MSTREIAELTGKQHNDVPYDTRKMLADLGKTLAEFFLQCHGLLRHAAGAVQPPQGPDANPCVRQQRPDAAPDHQN